jgi:glycosyltransferase involved in cell wall biosynthesis
VKVLLVSSGSGSRGGGEIFLDYLGQGLVERGHEVTIWIPAHARMDELAEKVLRFSKVLRADYRNTYDYKTRSLATAFNRPTSDKIARQWETLKPDIIHINKQNLEDGLDLLRAADHCSMPSVCTIHLTQTARYLRAHLAWLRDWIARRSLRNYDGTLVAVQETRREGLAHFLRSEKRVETIFNGVPLVDLDEKAAVRATKRRELGLKPDDFLVLGIGRLVAQKQPMVFLEVAKSLHEHFPNAKFLWVGDGKLGAEWDRWVAKEKLGGVISRVSWQADVTPFLLSGDLFLHVAQFEGLPFALVEAMSAGLPCAVTRDFAAEISLFTGENVLFLDDVESVARQLKDSVALSKVAAAGRQLVENSLSVAAMVNSYERLYAEAMRR